MRNNVSNSAATLSNADASSAAPIHKAGLVGIGMHRVVGVQQRFRVAVTTFANNGDWGRDVLRPAVAHGLDHPHAIRVLARGLDLCHLALVVRQDGALVDQVET